jgi:hypothetical protein
MTGVNHTHGIALSGKLVAARAPILKLKIAAHCF